MTSWLMWGLVGALVVSLVASAVRGWCLRGLLDSADEQLGRALKEALDAQEGRREALEMAKTAYGSSVRAWRSAERAWRDAVVAGAAEADAHVRGSFSLPVDQGMRLLWSIASGSGGRA